MSDTPRTDAIQLSGGGAATLLSAYYLLCCQLERDLAAAQARIKEMTEIGVEIQDERLAKYEQAKMPERPIFNETMRLWQTDQVMALDPVTVWNSYSERLRTFAVAQTVELTTAQGLLNHAVSLLTEASLSDDGADGDACMKLVEDIQKGFERHDKTSDWHYNVKVYDRLCAALGIDNGDEIDVLPLVEKTLVERMVLADENERDARRYRWLAKTAYRTSDLEPPHWCIPETCGLGSTIHAAIDAAFKEQKT